MIQHFFGNRLSMGQAYLATAAIAAVLLIIPHIVGLGGNAWVQILAFALLYVMLALGLNVVVGFAGLLDLGYIAFYAVGAYMYALLASPHLTDNFPLIAQWFPSGLHAPILFVIVLGAALAALCGALLGAPTLKLRGDYLAIVTLGFGEIVRIFMNNLNQPINITNGPQGITGIDPISMPGVHFASGPGSGGKVEILGGLITTHKVYFYYYLFLVLAILTIIICIRLQNSRIGRAWMAIREDEIAAKAMGINTRNVKLLAFAMGASFGGVAGAMFSAFQQFVSPESFTLNESIVVLAMVVLGGLGHVPGVIVGALFLAALPEVLRHVLPGVRDGVMNVIAPVIGGDSFFANSIRNLLEPEVFRYLLFGLAMVVIMLYKPKGIWPAPEHGVNPMGKAAAQNTPTASVA
jgi:branched-chain amino acid transport system permease protein